MNKNVSQIIFKNENSIHSFIEHAVVSQLSQTNIFTK